jgi:hypothetical protein
MASKMNAPNLLALLCRTGLLACHVTGLLACHIHCTNKKAGRLVLPGYYNYRQS